MAKSLQSSQSVNTMRARVSDPGTNRRAPTFAPWGASQGIVFNKKDFRNLLVPEGCV